jgi:hypothetical protein
MALKPGAFTSTTTAQLRAAYDASNYTDFTTGATGDLTIAPTGGDTAVTGSLAVSTTSVLTGVVTASAGVVGNLTGDITGTAPAGTLTGATLASGVTSSSLTSVGTIGTGTWSATAIAVDKGGTAITSYAAGDILYASGTATLAKLAKGSDTQVLTLVSGVPSWATPTVGDLTAIVAGTGLSGTDLSGPIPTLNVDASQTQITALGTIGTGVWQGTKVASAYLDDDTAHLSGTQTFSGAKTFSAALVASSTLAVTGAATLSSTLSVGTSATEGKITLGTGTGSSTGSVILRGNASQKAWKMTASQTVSNALEFIPSTAAGGITFSTPTMSLLAAGMTVTGTLAVTGAASFNSAGTAVTLNRVAASNTYLKIDATSGWAGGFQFFVGGTQKWSMGSGAVTGTADFQLYNNATANTILSVDTATDNVGIGTTTPKRNFHVSAAAGAEVVVTSNDMASGFRNFNIAADIAGTDTWNIRTLSDDFTALGTALMSFDQTGNTIVHGTTYIGDTANAKMTKGLTINQGAADNEILSLKSSDVAHGVTVLAETDTYYHIVKVDGNEGGAMMRGFSEATEAFSITAVPTTVDTTKSTTGYGALTIRSRKKSSRRSASGYRRIA